ncbi:hypothetical protein SDC9_123159 [bioreactor metagenome]|uniref:Uncharacterized protein n=1 Tax=bioreactor metagenome TaxID=1076179 RepID=A0A645CGW6_9ZZZZ
MLNAHAHGKGLCLHGNLRGKERFKGVPGGVADCKKKLAAGKGIRAVRSLHGNAGQGSVFCLQVRQPGLKPEVGPKTQQLLPHIFENDVEHVRAHMGFCID